MTPIGDPRWPRASQWLAAGRRLGQQQELSDAASPSPTADFAVLGVPAFQTSISPTCANHTPGAIRAALTRYSTWVASAGVDLGELSCVDLGDIDQPDGNQGEQRTVASVSEWTGRLLMGVGGDNSITYALARGSGADGLVTLDAHHDLRDGISNGSPVRRLIEAGLAGSRVVQVGISDFANSAQYSARAADFGITVIHRDALDRRPMADVMAEALEIASSGPLGRVHVDLDVDVCDRSVAPACPASVPGGISAAQLRQAARLAGRHPSVVSMDLAEIDALADTPDQRTVRLGALCLLESAVGLMLRDR